MVGRTLSFITSGALLHIYSVATLLHPGGAALLLHCAALLLEAGAALLLVGRHSIVLGTTLRSIVSHVASFNYRGQAG